ncbi:MAG TPA: hypothetical protein VLV89_05535 [Candidatus Acidoferrum sp.]|nr:hypothetical protein [Candidatus Acidoferrum sp.]
MISVVILVLMVGAMAQFGLHYWRSLIAGFAAQPLSERFPAFSGLAHENPEAEDFGALLSLHRLTPTLGRRQDSLSTIRAYYTAVSVLCKLPALHQWAQREMETCSRYVAVLVDQRLTQNLAYAAEMRSR